MSSKEEEMTELFDSVWEFVRDDAEKVYTDIIKVYKNVANHYTGASLIDALSMASYIILAGFSCAVSEMSDMTLFESAQFSKGLGCKLFSAFCDHIDEWAKQKNLDA